MITNILIPDNAQRSLAPMIGAKFNNFVDWVPMSKCVWRQVMWLASIVIKMIISGDNSLAPLVGANHIIGDINKYNGIIGAKVIV